MQIGHGSRSGVIVGGLALACAAVTAGCGGSSTKAATTPSPTLAQSPTPSASGTAGPSATPSTPAPSPSSNPATATLSQGAKSASCVNGWVQPAPGSDFYKQATSALQQSQGGAPYAVKSVRYFAGPLPSGGIGAVYYLDVSDPRLTARVLLVSGAGPASAAIARSGSTGWKAGDWFAFRGTNPPMVTPLPGIPHPGTWAGPEYDPVGGTTPLLSAALAGCLNGS